MNRRSDHYRRLRGRGLEIGALHLPAALPDGCEVEYFDLRPKAESARIFSEISEYELVEVQHVGDIDRRGLRRLGRGAYDFVVGNHVIEHLANPIAFVEDVFRLVRPGGFVVLSAPDKRFTFDRNRALTSFDHLLEDFRMGAVEVDQSHYVEFIDKVLPEGEGLVGQPYEDLLELVRIRREHVHVWDYDSFQSFMTRSLQFLNIPVDLVEEGEGEGDNREYLGVWRKGCDRWWRRVFRRLSATCVAD